jgi:transcription termination factor Rho
MHLNELKALHVSEVLLQAEALEIENTGRMRKQDLIYLTGITNSQYFNTL